MERDEKIKVLMEKAKISQEEAEEVLEKCNWDVIDSIIYIERKAKEEKRQEETKEEPKGQYHQEKSAGFGEIIGRIAKFIGRAIGKGNVNYLEIRKEGKRPIRISLTISAILLIVGFWFFTILAVIGLFLGYKYSIVGPNVKGDKVNDILGKASESADNIKSDFKEGNKES